MKVRLRFPALVAAIATLAGGVHNASAHPLDPALLEIREAADATLDVVWRLPLSSPSDAPFQPILPDGCTNLSAPAASHNGPQATLRWRAQCSAGSLVGQRIGVTGLRERQTDALLRVHLADGRLIQTVLRGDAPVVTIPERAGPLDVLGSYLHMGFEHILSGPDHLLFVLGLVLLVRGRRRLLMTITAFTLGHSVTLSLAVLGFVNIPPKPVEALIAFTIFIVAVELTRVGQPEPSGLSDLAAPSDHPCPEPGRRGERSIGETPAAGPSSLSDLAAPSDHPCPEPGRRGQRSIEETPAAGWMQRFPWMMSFTFGLLHGLGFAGALAQVGLPAGDVPLALFSFNIGIELGQLLFVAVVLIARAALRAVPIRWPQAVELLPAYAIGSCAVLWVFERVAAIF